jgi:GT2 family glycosyltransferase
METSEFRTTIVISTADRPAMVLECIRKFNEIAVSPTVEVLIVDASVNPIDEAAAKAIWPRTRVISYPRRNMAAQRNEGIRQATGEIICFLDDDTYVQPGWWPAIVDPFRDAAVGAVAGAMWCTMTPTLTDERGGYVNWRGEPIQVTHRSDKAPREVDWTIGCNMAFRKRAAESIGGLAEIFGIYDEDVDFGLRLKKAGWRIMFQPTAIVYHYFSIRTKVPPNKKTQFRDGRNRAMLIVRNYGLSVRLIMFLLTAPLIRLAVTVARIIKSAFQACGHFAAYLAGIVSGIVTGVRNPPPRD